jgi:hypothetical protein
VSSLATAQGAIVTALDTVLAPLPVKAHGGAFTEKELALLLGDAPCVLVAPLGIRQMIPTDPANWRGTVQWAAVCLAVDQVGMEREQLASDTASAIIGQLISQTWGLTDADIEPADLKSINAEAVYSGRVNLLQVAIWAVSWTQTLKFSVT